MSEETTIQAVAKSENGSCIYWCMGCRSLHAIPFATGTMRWTFNNDVVKPTLQPSVRTDRCHHFVNNGKIQFLADCKHEFAGKTVDMVAGDPFKIWGEYLDKA
jgi:hypothetical protein